MLVSWDLVSSTSYMIPEREESEPTIYGLEGNCFIELNYRYIFFEKLFISYTPLSNVP